MSTVDKIRFACGRSNLSIGKLEKYGIREVFMADGPQGIRRENGEKNTALPCGVALAASFDVRLAEQYGAVIGEEARACGIRASLGPGGNLMRTCVCTAVPPTAIIGFNCRSGKRCPAKNYHCRKCRTAFPLSSSAHLPERLRSSAYAVRLPNPENISGSAMPGEMPGP